MKTIGAKELRLHLDEILDRVLSGEEIIVSHRFKAPVKLSALHPKSTTSSPARLAGLHAFDTVPKNNSPYDTTKSIKESYEESISKKHAS